jgi:hypothetical protein
MIFLNEHAISRLCGGFLTPACNEPPDPPPNGAVWLPPNPDNPTANAPTTLSPN